MCLGKDRSLWYSGCDWDAVGLDPIKNDYLRSAAEKGLYPFHSEHVNYVGLEFTDELSLVDFIKCLSEIKDRGGIWVVTNMHIGHQTYIVCLVTYVHVSEKSMREFNKLVFTGDLCGNHAGCS